MASASSCFHCFTFACALLCMCAIHLSTGASLQEVSGGPPINSPSTNVQIPRQDVPALNQSSPSAPSPAPAPAPSRVLAPSPSPSPSPYPSPTPSLATAPVPTQGSQPESLRRRAARILGLVIVSFVGMLQAFVVLFLFMKRRQMLKHMYGPRAHRDPPHIWTNA